MSITVTQAANPSGNVVTAQTNPNTGGVESINGPNGSVVPLVYPALTKFALVGDSRTWLNHQSPSTTSPSSIVRSGGIVTCTFGSSHGLATGQKVTVYNVQDSTGTQDFSLYIPVVITRISSVIFTYADQRHDAIGVWGTSYSGGRTSAIHVMEWYAGGSWWQYLNGFLGGGLKLAGNYGWGGAMATDWLDNPSLILSIGLTDATDVILDIGINDVLSSSPVYSYSQIAENIQALASSFVAYGKRVWLTSIVPLGSGYSTPIPKNAKIVEVNRCNRLWCMSQANVRFVDTYSKLIDPMHATAGSALANTQTDNMHQSVYGARLLASKMAGDMSPFLLLVDPKIKSNVDTYAVDANSRNVLDAVLFANTTSGTTTGSTGTVTGLTVSTGLNMVVTGPGAVCTGGISLRSDGFGYDQTFEFTPSANNDQLQINIAVTSPATRVAIGDVLSAFADIALTNISGSNLKGAFAELDVYSGSVHGRSYSMNSASSAAQFGTNDHTFTMQCPDISAHSNVSITLRIYFIFSAAGTALSGKIGRVSVLKNS